jgi:lipoyl(octanoyl) transferase
MSGPHPRRNFTVHWLGLRAYGNAHALQEALVAARIAGEIGDTILLLEHPKVITLGRGASMEDVLADAASRDHAGVELFETGRGGQVTAHGPGQLVAYPIIDLNPDRCDVRKYIRDLGTVMVELAQSVGLNARYVAEPALKIGVWLNRENAEGERLEKIGAIGVRLSRWVTMHGFALNVSTDLSVFGLIVPCGMPDVAVTSFEAHGITAHTAESLTERTAASFGRVFNADVAIAAPDETAALLSKYTC